MKLVTRRMKTTALIYQTLLALGLSLTTNPAIAQETPGGGGSPTGPAVPLIQLDRVPLGDAIKNLARHAEFNFILAPRLTPAPASRQGGPVAEPVVTARWTNVTAFQALSLLLKGHGLILVTNAATTVVRIGLSNDLARVAPISQVGGENDAPIAMIRLDSVSLDQAIREIARQAKLNVVVNPDLPVPSAGPLETTVSAAMVSVQWRGLRPRQALAALLENYDLALVEDQSTSSAWIMKREHAAPAGSPKPDPAQR
jgi:hypothetical protein